MGAQFQAYNLHHYSRIMVGQPLLATSCGSSNSVLFNVKKALPDGSLGQHFTGGKINRRRRRIREFGIVASSNVAAPFWDGWKPEKASASPSLSDILWPSAGMTAGVSLLSI